MNEIALSNDLNQIELEINHHKNIAGQSIWEIGRRLNHVKENDLAHGEFIDWLENKISIDRRRASEMMKVAKEIPNDRTLGHLGETALYLIATLPEEKKQEELKKAEAGDPSTVRELRELKKQLKDKEQQLEEKEKQVNQLHNQILNTPPQRVETKEVVKEVKPVDYDNLKSDNEQLSKVNQDLQEQLNKLSSKLKFAENKYDLLESTTAEAKQLEATIKQMKGKKNRIQSMFDLADKTREINQFFDKEMAAIRFRPLVDIIQTEQAFNDLKETVSIVEHWAEEMRKMLPSHYIQEAEIVEE